MREDVLSISKAEPVHPPFWTCKPVEYVKVCPTYGPGFFYIPGTQTCIRVGGGVAVLGYALPKYTNGAGRTAASYRFNARTDAVNSEAQFNIFADVRDNTEYGLLRTYARIHYIRSSGSDDNSGSQPRRGQWFNSNGGNYQNLQTGFQASEAYVQLGGFLAGRTVSFAGPNLSAVGITVAQPSNGRVNQFAYTASLGSGMSLTGAVEDAAELRNGIFNLQGARADGTLAAATGGTMTTTADGEVWSGVSQDGMQPNNVPDLVASFDVAQSWGTAKLAGVWHHVNAIPGQTASSKEGYAITGFTKINLPMLAAGDNIQLLASYGSGTTGRTTGYATDTASLNGSGGFGNAGVGLYDAIQVVNADGTSRLSLSKSWTLGAQFQHFFSPTINAYIGGSYNSVDYGSAKNYGVNNNPGGAAFSAASVDGRRPHDHKFWGTELGVIWSPVTGLEINPSVGYRKMEISRSGYAACPTNALKVNKCDDDQFIGRLRVARSF